VYVPDHVELVLVPEVHRGQAYPLGREHLAGLFRGPVLAASELHQQGVGAVVDHAVAATAVAFAHRVQRQPGFTVCGDAFRVPLIATFRMRDQATAKQRRGYRPFCITVVDGFQPGLVVGLLQVAQEAVHLAAIICRDARAIHHQRPALGRQLRVLHTAVVTVCVDEACILQFMAQAAAHRN